MDNIRKIHHVCQIRLRKTFTTPRFYVALLWVLLEFQGTASGIRAFCKTLGIDAAFWILPFLMHRCFAQVMIVFRFCAPDGKTGSGEMFCISGFFR